MYPHSKARVTATKIVDTANDDSEKDEEDTARLGEEGFAAGARASHAKYISFSSFIALHCHLSIGPDTV